MIPSFILALWASGLLALISIGAFVWLSHEWMQRSWGWDPLAGVSVFSPDFGWDPTTGLFAGALALGLINLLGRFFVLGWLRIQKWPYRYSNPDPRHPPSPRSVEVVERPDGSQLRIYCYGDPDGEPLVATHGWGLSSEAWNYLKREIPHGCRLIVWDLPGLGESKGPVTGDYSLAKMAMDLDAVMAFAGKPCTLVGHSIGGMIIQTYMQTFPEKLRVRVRGAILVHTTPVDPVKTTSGSSYLLPLEGPLLAPLMRFTIALSPLVRVLNWLSYANGSTHLTTKFSSFAGHESWQQVDFAARFTPRASPAVLAAGMLEMMRYDALTALPTVKVPVAVIAGNRDSTTLPEASGLIYGSIEGAVLHTLTPAKHLGYIERHASFHQLLREFWRDRRMEIG